MSAVTHNGIQILPSVGDERAGVSEWVVVQAANADARAKFPLLVEMAERLIVVAA